MKPTVSDKEIAEIKKQLEKQKGEIEKQLKELESQDPYLGGDRDKIEEPATEAMEEEGHTRITATMMESKRTLTAITKALGRIEKGTYGICENCGKPIEKARLLAMPTATLCVNCEKSKETRRH